MVGSKHLEKVLNRQGVPLFPVFPRKLKPYMTFYWAAVVHVKDLSPFPVKRIRELLQWRGWGCATERAMICSFFLRHKPYLKCVQVVVENYKG